MNQDSYRALLDDLRAEGEELLSTLFELDDPAWSLATPAVGWDIHDQVVHLAFFDQMTSLALTRPEEFTATAESVTAAGIDWVDVISRERRALPAPKVLDWFVKTRGAVIGALVEVGPEARRPWFGPSMSAASSASARLMETWAHSQDIHDALGLMRLPSQRVRHVCHLGVLTRRFSYDNRGLVMPEVDVRVELVAPAGQVWTWGDEQSPARIVGDAWDFGLVVTQRRSLAEVNVSATPGPAAEWLSIAQTFAGRPSDGPNSVVANPGGGPDSFIRTAS
ncbi:uncharacterized protein (TIGR03084 family) [Nakamurella sp. UYEF19]|uniref:TIGR03084 family metal-binding protein n=1 Tax=Nakamurella sp. UYEF19 TaxID=1756392 RepID=UPI0033961253